MAGLAGAHGKLAEARFFLGLLQRIESSQPVTADTLDNEATYFTSALLNACYSVLEHLLSQGTRALGAVDTHQTGPLRAELRREIIALRARNADLYGNEPRSASGEERGIRHLVVHCEVVEARHVTRARGGFGTSMFGTKMLGDAPVSRHLYVEHPDADSRLMIVPRMAEHLEQLEALVDRWDAKVARFAVDGGGTCSCRARGA